MLSWLSANLINIALIAVIAAIVVLLIRSMIRDRKAGKSACGGNCACCGACSACSKRCTVTLVGCYHVMFGIDSVGIHQAVAKCL